MEINITWNICRVCLLEEPKNQSPTSESQQQMRHIFNDDKQLAKQIYECSGITVCSLEYALISIGTNRCCVWHVFIRHASVLHTLRFELVRLYWEVMYFN